MRDWNPKASKQEGKSVTNLLISDGLVLDWPCSPIGGLDDLAPEMLQLQYMERYSVSRRNAGYCLVWHSQGRSAGKQ